MILLKEMPTSGQFVAVWEHNNRIWCSTYYWQDGELFEWQEEYPVLPDLLPMGAEYCIL